MSVRALRSRSVHLLAAVALVGGANLVVGAGSAFAVDTAATGRATYAAIVPAPVRAEATNGTFTLSPGTKIFAAPRSPEAASVGDYLAGILRRSTGYAVPVVPAADDHGRAPAGISLLLGGDRRLGSEGYQLDVSSRSVVIRAPQAAGLFAGVQTLRQLFPSKI